VGVKRDCCDGAFELTLIHAADEGPAALKEMETLEDWIDEHHYLKGQPIRLDGTIVRCMPRSWDDVALADSARDAILRNVQQFLSLRPAFAKNGIPNRRGLLLYGPPGNGKTMIGKIIRATEKVTFLYVTAADCIEAPAVRGAFALARRLKPTILFLEDLDLYATDRRGADTSVCVALGEILAQLDGLTENDGLMVIATTNDLTAIEPAIRERPNRFDAVIEVGPPDADARRRILKTRLGKLPPLAERFYDEAVRRTDGYSGAQVQEAAWRIIQQAIFNGALDADGMATPTERDLELALPKTPEAHVRRRVGFSEAANG
jgi:SpoVK/Ycf46/Vps4 family AAA+-type ATPase